MSRNSQPFRHRSFGSGERPVGSLRRPPSRNITPNQSILIVGEGQTEKFYFDALQERYRLRTIEVQIYGQGEAPITVVDHALRLQEERRLAVRRSHADSSSALAIFDQVWCVFDTERITDNASFFQAVSKADSHGLNLAISNPAIEYWFLLHFENTTRSFGTNSQICRYLRKYITNYRKPMANYDNLCGLTQTAVDNAIQVENYNRDDGRFPHPSTSVHKLAQVFLDMQRY